MLTPFLTKNSSKKPSQGFTIVELLIVIVVIAILAAITIVSYNGIVKRAAVTELQADIRNASQQIAIDYLNRGSYPLNQGDYNNGTGIKHSSGTTIEYTSTNTSYCMTITSQKAATSFMYDVTSGSPIEGACPGHVGYVPGGGGGSSNLAWTAVSANNSRACGIAGGKVYCWGDDTLRPTEVTGLLAGKTATRISVGYDHKCAVANGAVYCWGANDTGQLGNGSTTDSTNPVAVITTGVLSGKTIQKIATGSGHSCALSTDNVVACWGQNTAGQLGTYNTSQQTSPVAHTYNGGSGWTSPLSGRTITDITAGDRHTCFVANSAAYCVGENGRSQLGFNATSNSTATGAVTTSGALNGISIASISAGQFHTCAIGSNARAYCWQISQYATTLNGTGTTSQVPQAVNTAGVLSGKSIVASAGGSSSNCVVATDGKVYCWGTNAQGQLGNNTTTDSFIPVLVTDTGALSGKTATSVAVGDRFACALAGTELYCWGNNYDGRVGDGTTTQRNAPVRVVEP